MTKLQLDQMLLLSLYALKVLNQRPEAVEIEKWKIDVKRQKAEQFVNRFNNFQSYYQLKYMF